MKIKKRTALFFGVCSVMCVYFISPANINRGYSISFVMIVIALVVLLISHPLLVKKILFEDKYVFAYIYPAFLLIYYLRGKTTQVSLVNSLIFLTIPLFFIFLAKKDLKSEIKILAHILMFYIIVICIYTNLALISRPDICRALANGGVWRTLKIRDYMFIAGFDFTYTLALLNGVFAIQIIKGETKRRKLFVLFFIIICLTIFRTQYTLAFIIMTVSVVLCIIVSRIERKSGMNFLLFFLLLITFLFNLENFIVLLGWFVRGSAKMSARIQGVLQLIREGVLFSNSDIAERINLYTMSIQTWGRNRLFGIGYTGYDRLGAVTGVGNHSELLDGLAYYGIIGVGIFLISIIIVVLNILNNLDSSSRIIYIMVILSYVAEMIVNPGFTLTLTSSVFLMVPILLKSYSIE